MSTLPVKAAYWTDGKLPANVKAGAGTVLTAGHAFKRFKSRREQAVRIGRDCMMDGVHFALGENAELRIGDYCYFTNAILLSEMQISIGSYVTIGWNATLADSDFHPVAPALRIADAIACSPAFRGMKRPEVIMDPVVVEDYVWIGPNAAILKGVRLGEGSVIEPGAVVTRDIPPRSRVLGNPARIIGTV